MNLLRTSLSARKRKPDLDSLAEDGDPTDSRPVFELVPPSPAPEAEAAPEDGKSAKPGRNVHPIGAGDLHRLSIDNDGRLYWDGKPVEIRRRILLSRAQVVGTSLIAAFVVIGALGAAIQASAAARDWACRLGWTSSTCTLPGSQPQRRSDIPA
jgi:hypothetical protein